MKTTLFILNRKLGLKERLYEKEVASLKGLQPTKEQRAKFREAKAEINAIKKRINYLQLNF